MPSNYIITVTFFGYEYLDLKFLYSMAYRYNWPAAMLSVWSSNGKVEDYRLLIADRSQVLGKIIFKWVCFWQPIGKMNYGIMVLFACTTYGASPSATFRIDPCWTDVWVCISNTYRALSNIHLDAYKCGVFVRRTSVNPNLCIGRCPKVAAFKSGHRF